MRKKLISLLVVFIIICMCVGFQFAYADTMSNRVAKATILSSTNLGILKGDCFDLSIDLTKITFENFKIELSSNIDLGNPSIDAAESLQTDLDDANNLFEICASKSDLYLDKLTMLYTLPESLNVGDSVQFVLKASSTDVGENADDTVIEDSITLMVVEKISNGDNNTSGNGQDNNAPNDQNNNNSENDSNKPSDNNFLNQSSTSTGLNNMQSFSVDLGNSSGSSSSKSTTQVSGMSTSSALSGNSQTVTYDGSDNNYLSSLDVEGFSFENDFSKTTSTYFITVSEDTSLLNINASVEDSSATVCVYGDTDLSSGVNKVLVSVTAENGSVRTYRIFASVK